MPHVHKISENSPLTERHDPVTGDAFVAGDKVVFCASCHSAFLADSWKYMGEMHCKQSHTLKKIPVLEEINLAKEVEDQQLLVKDEKFIFKMEKVSRNFYEYTILPPFSNLSFYSSIYAFIISLVSVFTVPALLTKIFSTYGLAQGLGLTFLLLLMYPCAFFTYNHFYVRPKKIKNPEKKPSNIGFHLGEHFLYLIKPDPKRKLFFLKKAEFEVYRYSKLKFLSLKYKKGKYNFSLQLRAETEGGKILSSFAKLYKKEVPLYLRVGLIEISQQVRVHYRPLNDTDRTVMKNLMGLQRNDIKLR